MPKKVLVTVTGTQAGMWTTAPYSKAKGLDAAAIYEVPLYVIKVSPKYSFKAIRFGLVNRGQTPPPKQRRCDAGIGSAQTTHPIWIPTYSPHSFRGSAKPGAWQVYPKKDFLIHEGTADKYAYIGGSLGCVEIVGLHEWNHFLDAIETEGGATCKEIGKAKALVLKFETAGFPLATLI